MKSKKLLSVLLAVTVISTVALAGCGSANSSSDGKKTDLTSKVITLTKATKESPQKAKSRKDTIIIGSEDMVGKFNLFYTVSAYEQYVSETIFDQLLETDGTGAPVAGLAQKWDVSSDATKVTYHLRDGLKFSDGTPLTADDVAFTFTFLADPHFADDGQQDISSVGIKGFADYNTGSATSFSGVKVVDAKTVEFDLDQSNSSALLTIGTMPILSKAYYGKDYTKGNVKPVEDLLNTKPFGSGQYKFVEFKTGQEVDLVANENYYKGAPKVKNLIFKINTETNKDQEIAAGDTDIDTQAAQPEHVAQFKAPGFLNVYTFPTGSSFGNIEINDKDPLLSDKKVRQALAYGLDRASVVKAVYKQFAEPINIPVSKASWAYSDAGMTNYKFDKDKANKLLDEAGWKKGSDGIRAKDGKKMEIHFLASTGNSVNDALIPVAKKNYEDLGIKFVADQMEFKSVATKARKHDFQMSFMGSGQTIDATTDLFNTFSTKGLANDYQYSNADVDKLVSDAYKETDQTKRKAILDKAYKILNEDLPSIPLYQRQDLWGINSRITGIAPAPYRDLFYDMYKAQIK